MLNVKRGVTASSGIAIQQEEGPAVVIDLLVSLLKSASSSKELQQLISEKTVRYVPLSIFRNRNLGIIEAIVYYLVEYRNLSINLAANLIARDRHNIRRAYKSALIKHNGNFLFSDNDLQIPIHVFRNNKLGPLESLVYYLRSKHLSHSRIADLTGRDSRTIWTAYTRAIRKTRGGSDA